MYQTTYTTYEGLRSVMEFDGSHKVRTIWTLRLSQCQGVMRCSELIKSKSDGRKPWDPTSLVVYIRDTLRGSVSVEILREEGGIGTTKNRHQSEGDYIRALRREGL